MKKIAKRVLRGRAAVLARRLWTYPETRRLHASWLALRDTLPTTRPERDRKPRVLIVPGDLETVVGSLGDGAMISATISMARSRIPNVEIDVMTSSATAQPFDNSGDVRFLHMPNGRISSEAEIEAIRSRGYAGAFLLGADILDGHYGAPVAAKLLVIAGLLSRIGVPAAFLGFSFNSWPEPALRAFFSEVDADVRFNVRDEVSLGRFEAFAKRKGRLVADSAFSLQPNLESEGARTISDWCAGQRAQGRVVVGLNVHPMLYVNPTEKQVGQIIDTTIAAIEGSDPNVAWLLLPHDYREGKGDEVVLRRIAEGVGPGAKDRCLYVPGRHDAATLKAMASRLDGIVSGRMHLAIAGLGSGAPVLALTYQGKFDGLFRLVGLPEWLLLSPDQAFVQGRLAEVLPRFLAELPDLKAKVGERLPALKAASALNYDIL